MGKKKDKKAKAKATAGGGAVAKEASGTKLPKGLRKAGRAAMKLAEQPVVSEAVAAALLAAAAALRDTGATKRAAKGSANAAADAAGATGKQASLLGDALKSVAIDVARRTVAAWEENAKAPKKGGGEGR
ncbi:MAG TPA: hypothetical protein VGC56_01055 [Allosphingosinicella sp.]|jgi:hypothetical protein